MSLTKSTNTANLTSLHRVQIIKAVYVTNVPNALSINFSELSIAAGKTFEEIEITDGTFSITDDDEGHGIIFKIKADFRHPKVREEAETFLQIYRGKLIRLILTDKNGISRLTPSGKLSIGENIPTMPGYNGYDIQLNAEDEIIPFIILPAIEPSKGVQLIATLDGYLRISFAASFKTTEPYIISYRVDGETIIVPVGNSTYSRTFTNASSFVLVDNKSNFISLQLFIYNISSLEILNEFTIDNFDINTQTLLQVEQIILRIFQLMTASVNFKTETLRIWNEAETYVPTTEVQAALNALRTGNCIVAYNRETIN